MFSAPDLKKFHSLLDLVSAKVVLFSQSMKRPSLFVAAAFAVLLSAGCSHIPFIGKKKAPDPNKIGSHVGTDTEKEYKQRWVERRSSELVSQGLAPDGARTQATVEFNQKFSATHVAQ
jgi:hypothetical protein